MIQEGNDIAEKRSLLEKMRPIYFWKKKIKNRNIQVVYVVHRQFLAEKKKRWKRINLKRYRLAKFLKQIKLT